MGLTFDRPKGTSRVSEGKRFGQPWIADRNQGRAWQASATIAPEASTRVAGTEASSQSGGAPPGYGTGMMSQ